MNWAAKQDQDESISHMDAKIWDVGQQFLHCFKFGSHPFICSNAAKLLARHEGDDYFQSSIVASCGNMCPFYK